jgi:hypothetical protein
MPAGFQQSLRIIQKRNWDGQISVATRTVARRALEVEELKDASGVYLLTGPGDAGRTKLYVGESDALNERLLKQDANRDFWDRIICLTQRGTQFDKAQVRYIEATLISHCSECGKRRFGKCSAANR